MDILAAMTSGTAAPGASPPAPRPADTAAPTDSPATEKGRRASQKTRAARACREALDVVVPGAYSPRRTVPQRRFLLSRAGGDAVLMTQPLVPPGFREEHREPAAANPVRHYRCSMADQGLWFKLWCSAATDPDLQNLSNADFARWAKFGL